MKREDWQPSRRGELRFLEELRAILKEFGGVPSRMLSIPEWLDKFAQSVARRMVVGLMAENARSWRAAAREGMRGREIYEALQEEMRGPVGDRVREILEATSESKRRAVKRLTMNHFHALQFLLYVEESTGSPHYDDVASLLDGGFWAAAGPQAEPPKFFTAEALAKLRKRDAHLGMRPFRSPTAGKNS